MSTLVGMRLKHWTTDPPVVGRFIGGPQDGVKAGMLSAPELVQLADCPNCGELHVWIKEAPVKADSYRLTDRIEDPERTHARYEWAALPAPASRPREREKVTA